MSINSSGNVGIGTSSPAATLHSVAGSGTTGLLVTGAASNNIASFYTSGGGAALAIDSSGSVGIGTTSPEKKLHIFDTNQSNQSVRFGNPSATPYGEINYNSTGVEHLYIRSKGTTTGYGNIVFETGSALDEAMRIDSSGNVLVGTTDSTLFNNTSGGGFSVSPSGLTQIAKQGGDSADPVLMLNQTGHDGEILRFYKDGSTVGSIGTSSGSMYIEGNPATGKSGITFYGSSIEPRDAGAASNGAIDLGATGSRFKDLYLSGTANVGGISLTPSTGTVANINIPTTGDSLTLTYQGTERVKLDDNGLKVYVHEMSTSSIVGYGSVLLSSNDNTGMGQVSADTQGAGLEYSAYSSKLWCWNGTFAGALEYGTLSAYSDERLKSDIQPITSALDTVTQIQGITYTKDGNPTAGVTAQQLETVLPNLVKTNDPDGDCHKCPKDADGNEIHDYKTVEYVPLIAYLIEAVKELSTQNAALEARITTLEV
jgi:hypothetical protein